MGERLRICREMALVIHSIIHKCGKGVERWNGRPAYSRLSVENGESDFRKRAAGRSALALRLLQISHERIGLKEYEAP